MTARAGCWRQGPLRAPTPDGDGPELDSARAAAHFLGAERMASARWRWSSWLGRSPGGCVPARRAADGRRRSAARGALGRHRIFLRAQGLLMGGADAGAASTNVRLCGEQLAHARPAYSALDPFGRTEEAAMRLRRARAAPESSSQGADAEPNGPAQPRARRETDAVARRRGLWRGGERANALHHHPLPTRHRRSASERGASRAASLRPSDTSRPLAP